MTRHDAPPIATVHVVAAALADRLRVAFSRAGQASSGMSFADSIDGRPWNGLIASEKGRFAVYEVVGDDPPAGEDVVQWLYQHGTRRSEPTRAFAVWFVKHAAKVEEIILHLESDGDEEVEWEELDRAEAILAEVGGLGR